MKEKIQLSAYNVAFQETAAEIASLDEKIINLETTLKETKLKLNDAITEKTCLASECRKLEQNEAEMIEEIEKLKSKLGQSDKKLKSAKFIATSALMKVDELANNIVCGKGEENGYEMQSYKDKVLESIDFCEEHSSEEKNAHGMTKEQSPDQQNQFFAFLCESQKKSSSKKNKQNFFTREV